jgi:hypothetical protein
VWAVALPLLDGLTVIQRRSARGVSITQPGADHLHHLLRAWGLGATAITAAETFLALAFAGLGIALWLGGAEEWVSLFLLLLLALVFRAGSDRAWEALHERNSAARSSTGVTDQDDGAVALAGSGSLDTAPGTDLPDAHSRNGER